MTLYQYLNWGLLGFFIGTVIVWVREYRRSKV